MSDHKISCRCNSCTGANIRKGLKTIVVEVRELELPKQIAVAVTIMKGSKPKRVRVDVREVRS